MKLNDVILEAASPAQQAAIAIAKKKKAGMVKEQQLDEFAPLLAAGARLFMAAAPKIAQVLGQAGQAGARGAGQAARAGTEIAAKNAGKIGMGAGAYEIGSSVADIAKDIAAKVGTAIDEKTLLDLSALAFKYAIPAGIVLAVLYGGKKAIDSLFDEPKDQQGVAEGKADYNFDIEDLKRLEQIRDLSTLKAQALALISKPSAKPMKPEKVEWFKNALERMNSPLKVIKLMYDLLLSGEGNAVVGSRSSMNPNSYRQRFSEQGVAEDYNGEYDDEAGMADNNLETLQRAVEGIDDLIQSGDNLPEWCQEKIAGSIAELQQVDIEKELEQHAKLKTYDELAARIKSLSKEKATLENALGQADRSVAKYQKEVEQLKDNKCPACEQDLHDHKHDELKARADKNLEESGVYLSKVTHDLSKVVGELDKIGDINGRPKVYYETLEEALRHQNNLATLESALVAKAGEQDPYQEQIEELQQTALQDVNWDAVNNLNTLKDHQEFLLKLLTNKDSFIRKKIIDQNLAYLNNRLTYYLDKMGLPHTVTFLNDLTVEIMQLGQDLDFDNLSRGERNRLILGLSWAFRDVWESLYQSINLLFIDELIDNGLDANGVENALSVLKKMGRERKKNIYLISHKDELIGRVNNVLKVIKENGFTSYANDLEIEE